jgi:hypothetical protein
MEPTTQIKSALRRGKFSPNAYPGEHDCDLQQLNDRRDDGDNGNCMVQSSSSPCSTTRKKVVVPILSPPNSYESSVGTKSPQSPNRRNKNNKTIAIRGYGQSGMIQSRTSVTSLLLHRWNQSYWLHVYPASLVIFDTEEKMKQWKDYYDEDHLNGIDLNGKSGHFHARKKLIQIWIDFDTQGQLQNVINMYELRQRAEHSSSGDCQSTLERNSISTSASSSGTITTIAKYAMEEVRSKYYSRKGPLMHTCKISYLSNTGRSILVAFGSTEVEELKKIRSVIRYCIKLVNKATKVQRETRLKLTHDKNSSALSAVTGLSAAVSVTKYGDATMDNRTANKWATMKIRMNNV